MMRAVFLSLILLLSMVFTAPPQMAFASDARTIRKSLSTEPFRDLPGVKLPQKDDSQARTACTSSVERQRPTRWRNGLGYRVYRCETEVFTYESTKEPDEVDWKKQKRYYKPWIDDGFDR
ncbi:MAG: hypothetical protein JWM58_3986 [Rhizobium sp.]|nr:hypothetical protein [Rhizobium sp.]